jgi:single-strand DNA-binding protein
MNTVSLVGNLTADPVMHVGSSNKKRTTFTVAVNEGQGEEERAHFVNCTAFGTLAENLSDSLRKGNRVVVIGRFNTYKKEVQIDGEDKHLTMLSVTASAVGPDLRWATAKVSRVVRDKDEADEPEDSDESSSKASSGNAKAGGTKGSGSSASSKASSDADDDDDGF